MTVPVGNPQLARIRRPVSSSAIAGEFVVVGIVIIQAAMDGGTAVDLARVRLTARYVAIVKTAMGDTDVEVFDDTDSTDEALSATGAPDDASEKDGKGVPKVSGDRLVAAGRSIGVPKSGAPDA